MQSFISFVRTNSRLEFALAKNVLVWEFDMYIAGFTPKSELTYNNLLEICQHYLGNTCIINVIDLLKNPKVAAEKQIMAIPTTIKTKPVPERILIGDLSNTERVISKLKLKDYQLKNRGTMVSLKKPAFIA